MTSKDLDFRVFELMCKRGGVYSPSRVASLLHTSKELARSSLRRLLACGKASFIRRLGGEDWYMAKKTFGAGLDG